MKSTIIIITLSFLLLFSCDKNNTTPSGAYPNKVKSINSDYYSFKYTEDGLLAEYTHPMMGSTLKSTAKLTWKAGEVTCNDGIGYTFVRPRNTLGYATPGSGDQQAGNNWTYDLNYNVTYLNGINYYWSNGNIDSLKLGSAVSIYEYTNVLDTRDYGAGFVPLLTNFPIYNLRIKNLPSKIIQLDAVRDTVSIRHYTYEYDNLGRVNKETETLQANGNSQVVGLQNYVYYD